MKNLYIFIFIVCLYLPVQAQFAGGSGTEADPWQITTIMQLDSVRNYLDGYFVLLNNLDFDGTAYDSIHSTEGWEPIGDSLSKFTGSFNGKGHVIENLYIKREFDSYVGLFGHTYGATLDSVGLENCRISGKAYIGGLVGFNTYYSEIKDCYATGIIEGNTRIGGLIGGSYFFSKIRDCYFMGSVSGEYSIGGLVGNNSSTLINCHTLAIVSGTTYTGGLVGYDYSTVINCYVAGTVSGGIYTGGLVGYDYGSDISNCYASSSVSGSNFTGGLVGYDYGSQIRNCYATGNVSGNSDVGGLLGYNSSTIINCYATGSVLGVSSTGGLIGNNDNESTISACYYNLEATGQSDDDGRGSPVITAAMKEQSTFLGWEFDTIWTITEGETFPRLQAVYNNPVIFIKNFDPQVTENTTYKDTIIAIGMDNLIISITLENSPQGMIQEQDSILSWQVEESGGYSFDIVANDGNGIVTKKQYTLIVNFDEGQGTETDPYQITTIAQLNLMRYFMDKHFVLMNDLDFEGSTYDNTNSTEGWEPIGKSYYKSFTGSFNGKGYIIKNLYINRESENCIGLFGYTYGAILDSINLENCHILGYNNTGSLVGCNNSIINNCYAGGNISGNNYVGGLVGDNSSTVSNCYTTTSVLGNDVVGGLVGYNYYTSEIIDCYATGKISGTSLIGGLVGRNYYGSDIINCYATGSVSGITSVGGLVGSNYNTMNNCYTTGNVSGIDIIGGLVGYNNYTSKVNNCYSIGSILGNSSTGGLIGYNESTVSFCYYNSETSGQSDDDGRGSPITTAKLKQQATFSDWDFIDTWEITEGETFPRLQAIYDNPVVFIKNFSNQVKFSNTYQDIVIAIGMDNLSVSLTLENYPGGMTLEQDSILSWLANEIGEYSFEVVATDGNGIVTRKPYILIVHSYEGQGTETNPFRIYSINQLDSIRNFLNRHFVLMKDLDFEGSEYDSTSNNRGWEPIGNDYYNSFTGSFNGKGHVIENLYINRDFDDYIGLFGYILGAVIDSIGLENCHVWGNNYTGGLVGVNYNYSKIRQSYTTGRVSGNCSIGGLVGYNNSLISRCYSEVIVSGSNDSIGGLVGSNFSTVSYSYAVGTVSGKNHTGGLVGYNRSIVQNCYATGSVFGSNRTGGLVGCNYRYSTVLNCYATGNVFGGNYYTGGLVGFNKNEVSNCYAIGTVFGGNNVGGLIGYNDYLYDGSESYPYANSCYYNIETTGQNDDDGRGSPITTVVMKQQDIFSDWDFYNTWAIRADSTYPALQEINNAPFAFPDTLFSLDSTSLYRLLSNDYDYETLQDSFDLKVINLDIGYVSSGRVYFPATANLGDTLYINYRIGEIRAEKDTLWGNISSSYLILSETTGITDNISTSSILVYPNPANDYLYIEIKGIYNNVRIDIISECGNVILSKNYEEGLNFKDKLDLTGFLTGWYIIKVQTNNEIKTDKFLLIK